MFSIFPWGAVVIMSTLRTHNCNLFLFVVFTVHSSGFISFLTVFLGSIDRYLAVFQPFLYQKLINNNPRFYFKWVCIIAICVFLVTGLSFLTENRKLIELVIIFMASIIIPIVFYIHARLHIRVKMVQQMISTQNPKENVSDGNKNNSIKNKNEHKLKDRNLVARKKVEKDMKMNNLTLMVYLSTSIAYLPFVSLLILWHIKSVSYTWPWTQTFYVWACSLTKTKSLTNPAIYFYRSKILRRSFSRISIKLSES
nr:cannabinoid receptor 1-like [Hydra vulgaris]